MITLYGIPNCSSVKKARQWLDAHGIDYLFHDLRKQGIDPGATRDWLARLPDTLINRKGTTWRALDAAQRLAADDPNTAVDLIVTYPTLIKRPLVQDGERVMVGFDAQRYSEEFGA